MVTPSESAAIEVDPEFRDDNNDADSTLESDYASSTASLTSSILAYRKIHGRTFENFSTGAEYWAPNDEQQNEGLDVNHQMLLVVMDNKLFRSPIGDHPQRVIDIGTGTGIWAIDFADQFPSAEVIGTDLSPIQPRWVPPNCKFELDDAQLPWTFPDNHFDFIHIRILMGCIKDWKALYKEVFRCLKPGGWFEHLDYDVYIKCDDGSMPPDSAWSQWGDLFYTAGDRTGRTFNIVNKHQNVGWMEEIGLVKIEEHRFKLPLNGWAADPKWKEVGNYNYVATSQGLEGYGLYMLTDVLGWDIVQTHAYLAQCRKELKNRSIHSYFEAASVFGQKPEAEERATAS